jgi:hypothetical protein
MPPCCASAGGLFSVALSVASPCSEAPWRYQARCPVKSSGQRIALAMPQDGVRTFLPLLRLAAQQPAITRPARWLKYTLQVHVLDACTIFGGYAADELPVTIT